MPIAFGRRFVPGLFAMTVLVAPTALRPEQRAGSHVGSIADVPSVPTVLPNDNRVAAGRLRDGELTLSLVVKMGRWYPEGAGGPSVDVESVAEEGRAPQIPAPLVRVRTGTIIVATVRNELPDSTVTVVGLQSRPATSDDSLRIAPGETRTVRFTAGAPGTYLYNAGVGPMDRDSTERETTGGAFVVDSVNARVDDRIFVVNIWSQMRDSLTVRNALAINGRSWPHTERITVALGDSVRWRVVNASARQHPLHMHGFYFRVDGRGGVLADTAYAADRRRLVVTERMERATTMDLMWYADRPGNWLFHCHLSFHIVPESATLDVPAHAAHDALATDPRQHMKGLILGITVTAPRGWTEPKRVAARTLQLHVQEGRKRHRADRSLGFVLQHDDAAPARDSVELVSSTLVLTRDEPTDIIVRNHLREPTGVHWHGIELESYSDGVAGWSGSNKQMAPSIAPGGSFRARLTLPRAGTFIYHTHLGDLEQLTSGLYGAIVVLEPNTAFDPRTDHVFVLGTDGHSPPPRLIVNGDSLPPPRQMAFGVKHRLRFVNIGAAALGRFVLRRDTTMATWRALAKDGADLVPARATARPAAQLITVGETYDFEFTPAERGDYQLVFEPRRGAIPWRQKIVVR